MDCLNPHTTRTSAHRCGRCANCLRYRGRVWSTRIMLEATQHAENCFVTLTYGPEALLRVGSALNPNDVRLWLMRLRKALGCHKIRYYLVGEYGGKTRRPHYHAIIFGLGPGASEIISKSWGLGFTHVGSVEAKSINYVTSYLHKKQSYVDEPWYSRLKPFQKCFTRCSTGRISGCGIGGDATWDIASEVMRWDLPYPFAIRDQSFYRPLGRYLSELIRVRTAQEKREFAADTVLQVLRAYAWRNDKSVRSVFAEFNEKPGKAFREAI